MADSPTSSHASRSAIVRATRSARWYPRALSPRRSAAFSTRARAAWVMAPCATSQRPGISALVRGPSSTAYRSRCSCRARCDAPAHHFGSLLGVRRAQRSERHRADVRMQIDAIGERSREARDVALDVRYAAAAEAGRVARLAARARIARADQLKRAGNATACAARAITTRPSSSGCRIASSTCRGSSRSSSRKSTPRCREAHLARPRPGPAADEPGRRDRVMRRAKWRRARRICARGKQSAH